MTTIPCKRTLLLALLCSGPAVSQANSEQASTLWRDIAAKNSLSVNTVNTLSANLVPQNDLPTPATGSANLRRLTLDNEQLQAKVQQSTSTQAPLVLDVPLPDGRNARIILEPAAVLSAELQQRYPDIMTWRIRSDHPDIRSGRAELTASGLRLMLRSHAGDQWLIEPESSTQQPALPHYKSYSNRHEMHTPRVYVSRYANLHSNQQISQQHNRTFSCGMQTDALSWQHQSHANHSQARYNTQDFARDSIQGSQDSIRGFTRRAGETLISYNVAISATGEYTQQFGGSETAAYNAIVTTVNRINEIYEQELGITLKLVSGTETVFSNPDTDPFENFSPLSAAVKNQQVLDSIVGSNRYDVGHVLGMAYGGDGVALLASLCREGKKAQGFTASNVVSGDNFIVDYVAHELGHQLGATHTFNSTLSSCGGGGRIEYSAFEPGSGSTIMSYAGLCASDNIQPHVDPQFHNGSVAQIHALTRDGRAASCATSLSLSNTLPVVNAGTDQTIPARTPFILSGAASDVDGDQLLYGWDQLDTGAASKLGTDTANNPLIMSSHLSQSGSRSVPDLSRLLTMAQTASSGESLPRSNRSLNFRLSVRDGKGASVSDDVTLTVHDTGERFSILSPTTSLSPGSHEISWQVAGTDAAPINCRQVDIAYTNNRGVTFNELLSRTDNDGSAMITLNTRAERIRVKCSDNIFFALSGTTPHVATYRNDTSQSSGSGSSGGNNGGTMTGSGGGGGSMPVPLLLMVGLLAGLLAAYRRLNSSVRLDRIEKHAL